MASSVSIGSVRSFGPSLETPFCSCVPQSLLWPLLTSPPLSRRGSPRVRVCSFRSRLWALQNAISGSWASCLLAHSPPTSCLTAHWCSFGRTFACHPFAPAPCGDDLAVRLRLAPQAPGGNFSSRQTRPLPGTRARTALSASFFPQRHFLRGQGCPRFLWLRLAREASNTSHAAGRSQRQAR